MITIEKACELAKKEMKGLNIIGCVDIGDRYAFSFGVDKDNIPPGTPTVGVAKENGKISYITIPPIENIDILCKGKEVII